MINKFKMFFGKILIVIGSFLTTYNLFSFRSSFYGATEGLPSLSMSRAVGDPATYYFYTKESVFLLSLGVTLLIIGVLIIKFHNSKNKR